MSFREKSAWAMATLLGCAGVIYLLRTGPFGDPSRPAALASFVAAMVIGSITLQVALALASPREANAPADERERPALDRAGHWSGIVLGVGVVTALLHFLVEADGNRLFHHVMLSLIAAQFSEYAFQITFFRRS